VGECLRDALQFLEKVGVTGMGEVASGGNCLRDALQLLKIAGATGMGEVASGGIFA